MIRALLDVNVMLALLDLDHEHHTLARSWLEAQPGAQWASCAISQNGYIRIATQRGYPRRTSIIDARARLEDACATDHHEFWPCDVSILDHERVDPMRLLGPKQITDVYLLALAVAHDGRFVTFDRGVTTSAVHGAEARHLVVL